MKSLFPASGFRWVRLVAFLLVAGAFPGPLAAQRDVRYRWQPVYYGQLEGRQVLLHNDSAFYGKPSFGDLDGDGDLDLLLGKGDGRINRFENRARRGLVDWVLVAEHLTASRTVAGNSGVVRQEPRVIALGSHAAPALVDIDQDGDLDLVVGTGPGRVFLYRNTGTEGLPNFELARGDFVSPNFGQRTTPFLADVDGDRDFDLFIGNEKGEVFFLENIGNQQQHRFCAEFPRAQGAGPSDLPCTPAPRRLTETSSETHAAPALVDWDGDGDLDLFVGKRDGTISFFRNHGSPFVPSWRILQQRFLSIDNGGFAAPGFIDTNGDGRPELLAGNSTNEIFLYTNQDTGRPLDVWKVTGNALGIGRIGRGQQRIAPTSGDLDGDGDLDLIVGDHAGNLRWVENTGSKTGAAWHVKKENLFENSGRRDTAPTLADMDGDGDLDLLVGGRDGRLWLVENQGSPKEAHWRLTENFFAGVDVGSASVPALLDIDGDGDRDLFVGNGRGLVIFYRNDGKKGAGEFRLVSTRFAGASVGRNAAPAFFDWNRDKKPDLVVGNREGRLLLTANGNPPADTVLRTWSLKARFWQGFQVKEYAIPHFADFNGDGELDLVVGDGDGNLRLWLNQGFEEVAGETRTASQPEVQEAQPPPPSPQGVSPQNPAGPAPAVPPDGPQAPASLSGLLGPRAPNGPILPEFVLASRAFGDLRFRGRAAPDFFDLDGDGDLDLVVGTGKGELLHLRNIGSARKPEWEKVPGTVPQIKGGRNVSPLFRDVDGDGLVDLLVGAESGRVVWLKNVGRDKAPKFEVRPEPFGAINVGSNSAPALYREKPEQPWQLLVGNFAGRLVGYLQPSPKPPITFRKTHRQFLGLDVGISSTPYFGDLERDGEDDLIVGADQGNLLNFKKVPPTVKNPWGWQTGPGYFRGLEFPPGSTPRLADIDNDGDPDLFVGGETGTLYFFRNDAVTEEGASGK